MPKDLDDIRKELSGIKDTLTYLAAFQRKVRAELLMVEQEKQQGLSFNIVKIVVLIGVIYFNIIVWGFLGLTMLCKSQ